MINSKRLKTKWLIGIIVLSVVILAIGIYVHGIRRVNAQELDRMINESLPKGTDAASVIKFLEMHHINHSEYIPQRHLLAGGIADSSIGMVREQIYLEFNFDESSRLLNHKVVVIQRSFWP